jgi:hypothetical protein
MGGWVAHIQNPGAPSRKAQSILLNMERFQSLSLSGVEWMPKQPPQRSHWVTRHVLASFVIEKP